MTTNSTLDTMVRFLVIRLELNRRTVTRESLLHCAEDVFNSSESSKQWFILQMTMVYMKEKHLGKIPRHERYLFNQLRDYIGDLSDNAIDYLSGK